MSENEQQLEQNQCACCKDYLRIDRDSDFDGRDGDMCYRCTIKTLEAQLTASQAEVAGLKAENATLAAKTL